MNVTETGFRTIMIRRAFDWTGQTGYEAWTETDAPIFASVISQLKRDLTELSYIRNQDSVLWQIEPPMDREEMFTINEELKLLKSE